MSSEIPKVSMERAVAFRPALALALGDVKAALMLSQALWKQSVVGVGGWWACTRWEWMAWTGLKRREQDRARRILREAGLLCERRERGHGSVEYSVDVEEVNRLTPESIPTVQTATVPNVPSNGPERTTTTVPNVQHHAGIMRTRGKTKTDYRSSYSTHTREKGTGMKPVGRMLGAEKEYRAVDKAKQLAFLEMKVRGIENGANLGVPMLPHVASTMAQLASILPACSRDERAEVKALQRRLQSLRC